MATKKLILVLAVFSLALAFSSASAFEFNGTVTDINGNALGNATINVTVRGSNWVVSGYNTTTTNSSGWFNITVQDAPEGQIWFYEPRITRLNTTYPATNFTDWTGKSLPSFPAMVFNELSGIRFFLQPAGAINITAVNSTGQRINFDYQVKDTKLGYPIAESFSVAGAVSEANVVVPRNRNYSIMLYPDASMPVSYNWNNFSASVDYTFDGAALISRYNATTKTLHKQFNTTLRLDRVSGYINYTGIMSWNAFTVVPLLMEPGNMVHDQGAMPYNLSAALSTPGTDVHNLTTGFFNISLPATVETSNVMLFAAARNGSLYYGGYRNISLSYNNPAVETANFNFTYMSGLLGSAADVKNITLNTVDGSGSTFNVTTLRQTFNFVNTSNSTLSNIGGHIETTVDYTSLNATEFTFMLSISQGAGSSFTVPLLNSTRVKVINAFVGGGDYAPVKKADYTVAQIQANNNITVKGFNPGDIEGQVASSGVSMNLYISNSTCDVPNPSSACLIGGTSQTMADFKPMSALLGGGKLSFRMGTGNILVHYANVDMLASGPPDALFDDNTNNATAGNTFDAAVRFGSGGPTIYDYILVSIPYLDNALDDTQTVSASMGAFYDDNWNVIWNTTTNGTNVNSLAGNYSHYSVYQSDWSALMGTNNCVTNVNIFNATNPCYIDTTANKIWIRLPHFSGTGPKVTGTAVSSSSSSTTSSSSSGSGVGAAGATVTLADGTATATLFEGESTKLKFSDGTTHTVKITSITSSSVTLTINPTITLSVGETKKVDIGGDGTYDLQITLDSITDNKASLTFKEISEAVLAAAPATEAPAEAGVSEPSAVAQTAQAGTNIWWAILIIAVIAIGYYAYTQYQKPANKYKVQRKLRRK